MSERLSVSDLQTGQFGSTWVWTDGSVSPEQALAIMQQGGQPVGLIQVGRGGRGSAWHVEVDGQPAVLRYYRRGGMMAHISQDRYIWQGSEQTRPYQEFKTMLQLSDAGLLVPRPLAAMAQRTGVFYRAALLTRELEHRGALYEVDTKSAWHSAGQAIAKLHATGVWHADLNVHNILIDHTDRAWLIDFDRAQVGVTDRAKLRSNLGRLLRSVRKVCPELAPDLWPVLLDGYASVQ